MDEAVAEALDLMRAHADDESLHPDALWRQVDRQWSDRMRSERAGFERAVVEAVVEERQQALTEAADEVRREARWQQEMLMRNVQPVQLNTTGRLAVLEEILRARAAGGRAHCSLCIARSTATPARPGADEPAGALPPRYQAMLARLRAATIADIHPPRRKPMSLNVEGRHLSTQHFSPLFSYEHLPKGKLRTVSLEFTVMAQQMIDGLPDGPELTAGLRKLLEAKDCFVRAAVLDMQGGRDQVGTDGGHGTACTR